jgi:hypothetical protein
MSRSLIFWRVSRAVWLCASVAVLVRSLSLGKGDAQEAELILMLALGYPCTLVSTIVCFHLLDWSPSLNAGSTVLLWLAYFVAGLVQWFMVVPYVFRKVHQRLSARAPQSIFPNG